MKRITLIIQNFQLALNLFVTTSVFQIGQSIRIDSRITNLIHFLLFFLLFHSSLSAQIGINLSLPEKGGTYIDVAKENYRWQKQSGGDLQSGDVDLRGWPMLDAKYIWDNRPTAEWIGQIDDPEEYRIDVSGTYKCSFIGMGNVTSQADGHVENKKYDLELNTTTFDFVLDPGTSGLVVISFEQTKRNANADSPKGFVDFKMLRPGYVDDEDLFHQPLTDILNEIKFSAIRYMVFTGTNGTDPSYPKTISWSDRKSPLDASQNSMESIDKPWKGCWEHVIRLSNETMTDPWINIPISADSSYIIQLAQLFKDNLDPELNLYLESSNEVWNTAPGFEQTTYNRLQSTELGISEWENHGRRTVEIAQFFSKVYGVSSLNNNIRVILCSHQPMLKWWVEPSLQYINDNFGKPSKYIYGIANQTYFSGGSANESITKLLDNCHQSIKSQIEDSSVNEAGRKQWIQKAKDWKLIGGYFSYEGGPDHGGGSTTNIENRILIERTEQMCELLKYNYDTTFLQLGANMAMQFTLTSGYSRYGNWGLTDDINVPYRNYKMSCIKDILDNLNKVSNPSKIDEQIVQMFPNPSLGTINLKIELSQPQNIKIELQNILSQSKVILDQDFLTGVHHQRIPLDHYDTGSYFLRIYVDNTFHSVKKLILIK